MVPQVWQRQMFHGGSEERGRGISPVPTFSPLRLINRFKVFVGDLHLVFKGQIRVGFLLCFKVMVDLVERVGISHGSSANHDCFQLLRCVAWLWTSTDITVGDEWNLG